MEKKPLEHTRLLIQERIDKKEYLLVRYPENGDPVRKGLRDDIEVQLSDLEQGLKAVNSHYELLEALKTSKEYIEAVSIGLGHNTAGNKYYQKVLEAIKQCEG